MPGSIQRGNAEAVAGREHSQVRQLRDDGKLAIDATQECRSPAAQPFGQHSDLRCTGQPDNGLEFAEVEKLAIEDSRAAGVGSVGLLGAAFVPLDESGGEEERAWTTLNPGTVRASPGKSVKRSLRINARNVVRRPENDANSTHCG